MFLIYIKTISYKKVNIWSSFWTTGVYPSVFTMPLNLGKNISPVHTQWKSGKVGNVKSVSYNDLHRKQAQGWNQKHFVFCPQTDINCTHALTSIKYDYIIQYECRRWTPADHFFKEEHIMSVEIRQTVKELFRQLEQLKVYLWPCR